MAITTLLVFTTLGAILLAYSVTNIWAAGNSTQTLISSGGPVFAAWSQWKVTQSKTYLSSTQENFRFKNFSNNYSIVSGSNANPKNTFTLELNKFADQSAEEFKQTYLRHTTEVDSTQEEGFT
jgi:C1A family cysteine protease